MVTSASLTGHWPDLPLTYAKGDFDIARRGSVRIDGEQLPRMAPLTEDTAKEYDGEFAWLCDCLIKNKVPATKITLDDRTLGRGDVSYTVHFASPILDPRDATEKRTISFQAYGAHHALKYGYDKAAAMAYLAFMSSRT